MRVSDKHCRVDFDGFEQIFADIPYWERDEQLFLFFAGRRKDNKDQIGFNEEAENEDSSKEERRNISTCTSGTSKYSVFTSSIPHVGIWDSSPHKLLRRAKAVEKMLCDLLQ